ncbi:hypothetical protein DERP_006767 [Dermatophagoides pteronyssinus]|uniref:Uncharacterized protein n=1 Tax=Dermatophagoides pteronyssinus TaxID=6956 RepID=A0ABQ8ISB0_DERPT|nr:hypothetical protein DERP_006767 [Dermatophagoides pteronyssinus]
MPFKFCTQPRLESPWHTYITLGRYFRNAFSICIKPSLLPIVATRLPQYPCTKDNNVCPGSNRLHMAVSIAIVADPVIANHEQY